MSCWCSIEIIAVFPVLTMFSVLPSLYFGFIPSLVISISCFHFHLLINYFAISILEGFRKILATETNSIVQIILHPTMLMLAITSSLQKSSK